MSNFNIETTSYENWKKAQEEELRCWSNEPYDFDDWNSWWALKFDNYEFLDNEKKIDSIYEVGCGPYAKNIEYVMKKLGYIPGRVLLEDPLLNSYVTLNKSVKRFQNIQNSYFISEPMESFSLQNAGIEPVDLLICNNVLDHVRSVELCFDHIDSSLNKDGIFIFGQDLTSEEDVISHGDEVDVCHPIRLDEASLEKYLEKYSIILKKILPRNEGRNPSHHYATLIFVGRKK